MISTTTLFNNGSMPVLERLIQFTEARHRVLSNNVANLSTPYFKPTDLDPQAFQQTLRKAIDRRNRSANPAASPLKIQDTRQLTFRPDAIDVTPQESNENILFHDQNNRDLERVMARVAENTLAHRTAIEFLRHQYTMLETAIRGRI